MYFPVGERSKVSGWKSGHNVRIPIQPEQVRTHPISNRKLLVIVWQLKMAKKQKIGKKSKKSAKNCKKGGAQCLPGRQELQDVRLQDSMGLPRDPETKVHTII